MVKLSEISKEQFLARVITDLNPKTKNLDAIVTTIYNKRGNYQIINAIGMIKSAIQKDDKLEHAMIKTGIIIGTKDKKGSKAPIKCAFLVQNQAHIELILWDTKVPYADGVESQLIFPAGAEVAMSPTQKGGMGLERILRFKRLNSAKEVIAAMEKIKTITTVKGVREPDKENYDFPVTVLKGEIISAGAIMSSAYDEEEKTYFNVWEQNEKKVSEGTPALNLKLKTEDEATIWAKITPRRYAKGYYDISDLETACQDAIKESDDPKAQAEFVGGVLNGKKVIVVGSVSNKDDNPKYGMTIGMDTFSIIEIPTGEEEPKESEFEPQQKLPETKNDDTKPEGVPVSPTDDIGQTNGTGPIGRESETNNESATEAGPGDKETNGPTNEVQDTSTLIDMIKEDMLLRAGIFSKKKRIDEKKKYLAGMKLKEDILDKLKYDDWLVVKAAEMHIELTKEIAATVISQAYEELTQ